MSVRQGVHIIQSNRLELLADRLLSDLRRPPLPDPLEPEVVVVQDSIVSDWLDLLIAREQGISANMSYRSPGQFIWDLYRRTIPGLPVRSPFDAEVLRWHILRILEEGNFLGSHPSLSSYLERGDSVRRFELAVRLAELFNRYLVYRMDWLEAWEEGNLRGLGPDEEWQAQLWRRLTEAIHHPHRARLFTLVLAHMKKGAEGLPRRVSVFGISSLSPAYVTLLQALGTRTEVRVYVLNPCQEKWDDIADERLRVRTDLASSAALMHIDVPHALLGSLGKQGRDFIRMVVEAEGEGSGTERMFEDPGNSSLLHALQSGILRLAEDPVTLQPGDTSIHVHSSHTHMREVEILYDRLLALLDADTTLLPSDILVLAPDIDLYAPYIEAVFRHRTAAGQGHETHRTVLPFDIADRTSFSGNGVVEAWRLLLDLPRSRCEADQILDLLRRDPIRTSFSITAGELDTLAEWVEEAGIRWGFSGTHKSLWHLPPTEQFTWIWGLERLVLGVGLPRALAGDRLPVFHGLLPVDTVEGRRVDLLNRFIGCVEALRDWVDEMHRPRPMAAWGVMLSAWLDRFIGASPEYLETREQIRELIIQAVAAADEAGHGGAVDGRVVRSLLLSLEVPGRGGTRFPSGGITFSSMKPLRPLPFRIIALLGMGDGEFPRNTKPPSFDLMQLWYRHGDRSSRLDDRYLFLELLLSARERILISYRGEDVKSGKPRPMSPVVAELLEFIGKVGFSQAVDPEQDPLPEVDRALHIRHPLQAFSPSYFDGRDERLFSYSAEAGRIAAAVGSGSATHHVLFAGPLPEPEDEFHRVRLDDLCRFYRNPVHYLFTKRLGVRVREEEDVPESLEPLAVGKAETRAIYRALHQFLPNERLDETAVHGYLLADGRIPLGVPGAYGFERVLGQAAPFMREYRRIVQETRLDPVGGDMKFDEWIIEIHENDITPWGLCAVKPGKLYDGDVIAFWIRFLAVSCLHPSRESGSLRGRLLGVDGMTEFPQHPDPRTVIRELLVWYGEGLRRPLHFFPGAALSYAREIGRTTQKETLAKLRKEWDSPADFAPFKESRDSCIARTFFSAEEALDNEFVTLATLIAVQSRRGIGETNFTTQRK